MICDECGGTGMWDVLSSIPCSCMSKVNKQNTLNRIVRAKERARKDRRYYDETVFRSIELKIIQRLKDNGS